MKTIDLRNVFKDTHRVIQNDFSLKCATEETCLNTKLYNEGFYLAPQKSKMIAIMSL